MATDSGEAQKYEISYIVSGNIPEDDAARITGQITRVIEDAKGMVRKIEEPKKRRLAYPVNNDRFAYFGYTTFTIEPSAIPEIEKKLRFEKDVTRHIIVEEETEPPRKDVMRAAWRPRDDEAAGVAAGAPKREVERSESAGSEEIDKRLDEILGS